MVFRHPSWRPGSKAVVRIDLAALKVPKGCVRKKSITANANAGSVVCARMVTRID
jgi:hypothetical protein